MSFDWENYLNLAKKFKKATDNQPNGGIVEAMRRTAISRAYYSCFHLAESKANTIWGYVSPSTKMHPSIITQYKKQMGSVNHQEIGRILSNLWRERILCDYKSLQDSKLEAKLQSVILQAERMRAIF